MINEEVAAMRKANADFPAGSVFVFGSNLAGRHGAGAALHARQKYGAIYGQGIGRQGMAYAIPTKGYQLRPLPLDVIAGHVCNFLAYAREHSTTTFLLTEVGCGLAGFTPLQIAPMFADAPDNVAIPESFAYVLFPGLLDDAANDDGKN